MRYLSLLRRPSVFLSILVLLVISAVYGYHRYSLIRFERAYLEYAAAATRHDDAASIPALAQNPLRQDLNRILSDVLTGTLSTSEREERAREGLTLLILAEGHIDAVGEIGKDVADALFLMEGEADTFGSILARSKEKEVIALARERMETVADIRGLSYRANNHTGEIFDRLLADKGELTSAHAIELDKLIPSVEAQFNERSNLYIELGRLQREVANAFARVEKSW